MARIRRLLPVLFLSALWVAGPAVPASAGGGCHAVPFTDERTNEIQAHASCFTPVVARVRIGDTVTWRGDGLEHTVTGANGAFDAGSLHVDGRTTHTFTEAGVYPYACYLHPGMVGAVVVGDPMMASAAAMGGPADDSPAAGIVAVAAAAMLAALIALGTRSTTRAGAGFVQVRAASRAPCAHEPTRGGEKPARVRVSGSRRGQ